jgi:flavin-dependent dehydrogenase
MAAHELARRGASVLLVDRATFPRWKVCGCCLNGRALATLRDAGLGDLPAGHGAVPLGAIEVAARGRSARLPLGHNLALSRDAFDASLVRAAVRAGAEFLPQTHAELAAPERDGRPVRLRREGVTACVRARVVLAADGLGGKLLARSGMGGAPAAPGARIGAGVVASGGPGFYRPGTIYMACGARGYLGLVRLEDGRLDLAAALDVAWVRASGGPGPAAAALLGEVGWPVVPDLAALGWRGTPALTRQARRLAADRLFVVGDAAGYVEPFTGEGIAWALAAGRAVAPLAARAARRWQPSLVREWEAAYRCVVVQRQYACRAAAAVLRHPLLARALIHLLARAPALARPFVRHLDRKGS